MMTEGQTAETAATKQRLSAEARQLDRANAQGIDSGTFRQHHEILTSIQPRTTLNSNL
jgi:hypothetical protein